MKIQLWSVGKPHEPYVKEGIEEFTRRLNKYFKAEWQVIAPPRNAATLPEAELKKQEADVLLHKLQEDDFLVLLDERGRNISSVELSALLQQRANESVRNLVFLIGGAFGVDARVQQRANYSWSLSRLVFPHMLVRLILSEQLYRACTILRNEKYHHT
jgi:23S rRNA (pseudouridine1915-N3)-methyltransferase